ncbi:MAG: hypothetical protein ACPGYR_06610 [Chitinophagales bacterium]
MKNIVIALLSSSVILSCSKSIELPNSMVKADEKTCECFEPTAAKFKEIRDFYIDNYNSWEDDKVKEDFVQHLHKAMKAEQSSKDCVKDWASSQKSSWHESQLVSSEEEYDYYADEVAEEEADYSYDDDNGSIVRAEGRFILNDALACYEVFHLMYYGLVDNEDHIDELEDYILEVYEYDEDFMSFLSDHVGIYLSEYDYERYEEEQNRNRDRGYDYGM